MLTFKRLLAASSAVVLGAGSGFATSVYAQVTSGPPQTSPGNPPVPGAGPTAPGAGTGQADNTVGNFRRDATLSVSQHPREGYEAQGIRAGTFLIYPQVSIQAQYDDNIYATDGGETSDLIWRVQPQVTATSDWIRHALQLYVRGSLNAYQDHSSENTNDWSAGASGRLDVSRDTVVNGRLDYSRATEPRTSANSPSGALEPVRYNLWTVSADGSHEFNRVRIAGRASLQAFNYDSPPAASGGFIDQSFRDRQVLTYGGRLDYALSPKTAVFVDVSGDPHVYDHTPSPTQNRDSNGYQALVGVNFELTHLARGDIGVGYRRQTFDAPGVKPLAGLSTNASLEWFPTQLTTVTFNATRTIEDSAVPNFPGYLSTNVSARVDHELLRNVILNGRVAWGDDKYAGVPLTPGATPPVREDRRTNASLGASYLVNRNVGLSVAYEYSKQETRKGIGNNFTDNKIAATLTVQY